MTKIKTLYLTGYRSFELGIFQENDPKIAVIKKSIKSALLSYLDEGLEWVLIGGQLGVELWGAEVVGELKADYPELQLGLIYPFTGFGQQWNEQNQNKLAAAAQKADYVNAVSRKAYESPQQLRNHSRFLLEHSGGVLLVYDEEYPGKCQYFLKEARQFQESFPYEILTISFDDLQNSSENSD